MGHLIIGQKTDLCLRAFSLDTCLDNIVRKKYIKKTLYLSANVFSTKAPIEDVIFFDSL